MRRGRHCPRRDEGDGGTARVRCRCCVVGACHQSSPECGWQRRRRRQDEGDGGRKMVEASGR